MGDKEPEHDTQVKQEDVKVIHDLFSEFHYADDLGVIKSKLVDLLATMRREVFKDAMEMIDAPVPGTMASTEFHKGFESMRRLAKQVLERAALEASTTEKGEGNG